jgi:hypothetical protein
MNNIVFFGRAGFEYTLLNINSIDYTKGFTDLNVDDEIEKDVNYIVTERESSKLKKIFTKIMLKDQTNIRVFVIIGNPCVEMAIDYDMRIKQSYFDYYVTLYKCIENLKSLFNSKVEILKYEELNENCTVDYNKYLAIEESKHFDSQRYEQLVDLCRYLPRDRDPMRLFGFNEIPLSVVLKQDEELILKNNEHVDSFETNNY